MIEVRLSDEVRAQLGELDDVSPGATDLIIEALAMLERHPLIGREVEDGYRELVISRGKSGYVALYRFVEARDLVRVVALRHQREAGWGE